MFLNLLTINEKELFLSLAIKAAEANGCVESEEIELINDYSREMDITAANLQTVNDSYTLEQIYAALSESELAHKRMIMFEIIGLMHADNTYDEMEMKFVLDLADGMGVTRKDVESITQYASGYIENVKKISEFFVS